MHQTGGVCLNKGTKNVQGYLLGIDVGSTSSDMVVLEGDGRVVFSDYRRTQGRPLEVLRGQITLLKEEVGWGKPFHVAVTGTAGRMIADILEAGFVNEVTAQAGGIAGLYPSLEEASVIEMGGQDSKLIFLGRQDGRLQIRDFALNTACAAGTGSFLDQQAQRLGVSIEREFGELAISSTNVPRIAGRCSVFAKSDMIHLQQQATPVCDIVAGLCLALARNLKSNLGCGKQFAKPIIFTGGVAANAGVIKSIEKVFGLGEDELIVPDLHLYTGAVGAVAVSLRQGGAKKTEMTVFEKLEDYLQDRGTLLKRAARRAQLTKPSFSEPASKVHSELLENQNKALEAYLGVDVGSISTNLVVIDASKRVLCKEYLMTAGRPLEAIQKGLALISQKIAGKVQIAGAAATGSGRYVTGDFIGADVVINEITAQAAGAAIVEPQVDTIFEIGGQDSKYIAIENGVVVDFEMNHACAAGTGSFLEEQAQRLNISIKDEFSDLAFGSKSPIKIGERCTVFMESDLSSHQQQGAALGDLVAGLSYSVATNYLNRVVGRRKIGERICFQGGTAFNKAVWAAFEKILGKPVRVPDHHEVTGALGAASIAAEHMKRLYENSGRKFESEFRGFENLTGVKYQVNSFTCKHCSNHCEVKKVRLGDSGDLYYGAKCDRYEVRKKKKNDSGYGAFALRNEKMLGCSKLDETRVSRKPIGKTIAIPRALIFWQLLPMFRTFFQELGLEVIVSEATSKSTIQSGIENVTAQVCFPTKVAYGHVASLLEKGPDYLFLPSIVSMTAQFPQNKHNHLCPYVQSFPYQIRAAFANRFGETKLISPVLRLGDGERLVKKSFLDLAVSLGASKKSAMAALEKARKSQRGFQKSLVDRGRDIIESVEPGKKLFVLVSRPYNGCDPGVNLDLPQKLAEHGVDAIPMEMLDLDEAPIGNEQLHERVYWSYGQKILRAAEIIKKDPRLFAIYVTNFNCGPDSFMLSFFKDIMAEKPCLQLELDEHSADAGVVTRIEAFLDSLEHFTPDGEAVPGSKVKLASHADRKLFVPYMGDAAYGIAAVFRSYGQPAEVIPLADDETLIKGRQFTTGKECLPCAITAGDMLDVIDQNGANEVAFFMPGGCGPCRFGMYNCLHKHILKHAGVSHVPILSPNQGQDFYSELQDLLKGRDVRFFMKDIWVGAVSIELLYKLLLRVRPFAISREQVQKIHARSLNRLILAAQEGTSLNERVGLMESIAEEFSGIEISSRNGKPKIGIVGEIYVRNHPFANAHIINRLEGLGAACELASSAEWIYYTNVTRRRMANRRRGWKSSFQNMVQNGIQRHMEKKLARPLETRFGPLAEGRVEKVLQHARPYIDDSFEGEAVLSIGKTMEYYHGGCAGVVNVMPFGCMPSTIVTTQTMQVAKDCGDMPILNITFDGQEDPTLTTRLEAFVEQVRTK